MPRNGKGKQMRDGSGNYVAPSNSWNPAISGQQAVYSDWQAILNDIVAALTQSVSRDGQTVMTGNLQMGGNKITGQSAATGAGQALIYEQLFNQGTEQDLASAATTDIGAQLTNFLRITGTTTITSFGTNYKGPRFLRFEGAVTLTNSSTLIIPGGANITTAAGDCLIVIPKATGGTADGWQVVAYQSATGGPVAGSVTNSSLADGAVYGTKMTSKIEPVAASVASNALTATLNPTTLDFRSSTLGSGTVNTRTISTAISAVVPSSATLGTTNATLSKVMLLAIDNAGTVELAVCNGSLSLDESTLISTTVLDTSSDSASVIYSTTARTNVPFRIVGYVESIQTTAGTWATAPSKIQGVGGQIRQASTTSGGITSGTAVTASGTSIDFTSIPSWVKRITVMFNGVSTSGTSRVLAQIGSGSVITSGYSCLCQDFSGGGVGANTPTTGFAMSNSTGSASSILNGHLIMTLVSGNIWVASSNVQASGSGGLGVVSSGNLTLSGTLDRVRITTVNGTDIFDAGSINILME